SYSALFAGERTRIDGFKAWLIVHKAPGERLRDITEASPQIRNAVERAGRFLSLASLVSVLLCAIAVAMAARRYVHRHLDTVALLKTLGATRAFTLAMSVLQLLALALLAAVAGAGVGRPRGSRPWRAQRSDSSPRSGCCAPSAGCSRSPICRRRVSPRSPSAW